MWRRGFWIATLGSALCILGCNNDGPGGEIGVFIDGLVQGVTYETPTRSGVTNDRGEFRYEEGESVTFRLGDTVLGSAVGKAQITPFDLVGIEVPTGVELRRTWFEIPFATVTNIAVLLQTFDEDADPSNGIKITSDVSAQFSGASVELEMRQFDLYGDFNFRRILGTAKQQGLLSGQHQPRHPALALAHLYQSIGVDPNLFVIAEFRRDDGIDSVLDRRITFTHDTDGFQTREERDDDADGALNEVNTWAYNSNKFPTRRTIDSDGDGSLDQIIDNEYNQDGYLIFQSYDDGADGRPDLTYSWERDSFGSVTRFAQDTNGDGIDDEIEFNTYNDAGQIIRKEYDDDGNGTIDRARTFEYNEAGQLLRRAFDNDLDGTEDDIDVFEYDEDGNRVSMKSDEDGDGDYDRIVLDFYDPAGNPIRTETDTDGDGTPEFIFRREYNDAGQIIREESEDGGVITRIATHEYDEAGNELRLEEDNDADPEVDFVLAWTYNDQGLEVREETFRDLGAGLVLDRIAISEYDADGNRIRLDTDEDADETADTREEWDYISASFGALFFDD